MGSTPRTADICKSAILLRNRLATMMMSEFGWGLTFALVLGFSTGQASHRSPVRCGMLSTIHGSLCRGGRQWHIRRAVRRLLRVATALRRHRWHQVVYGDCCCHCEMSAMVKTKKTSSLTTCHSTRWKLNQWRRMSIGCSAEYWAAPVVVVQAS